MRAIVGPCCDRYGPRKTSESEAPVACRCHRPTDRIFAYCSDMRPDRRRNPLWLGRSDQELYRPSPNPILRRYCGSFICALLDLVYAVLRQG